jgi:hypothetical protein
MSAISTTRRLISSYAECEPWKEHHDQAMLCWDVEEKMAWGINLLQGLSDLEARLQARVLGGREAWQKLDLAEIEQAYRSWVTGSESLLRQAEALAEQGFPLDGLAEFRGKVEEVRCQIELWDLEPEIRPIEEALPLTKPENPRPARYGS